MSAIVKTPAFQQSTRNPFLCYDSVSTCDKPQTMRSLLDAFRVKRSSKAEWVRDFFTTPLVDLAAEDSRYTGIWTPEPELGAEKVGISEQFLANAEIYHHRYSHANYLVNLLEKAFESAGSARQASPVVLDIGTGSGKNSLFPMLHLFPDARFVATDLSPDLLAILQHYAVAQSLSDQIACVCADAMKNYFMPASFDVATGIAILHHLLDPSLAIKAAFDALKDDGIAVFYEPFEGFGLITMAYERILEEASSHSEAIDPLAIDLMRAMVTDINARRGTDKSDVRFRYMDDKWLFTRTYVEDVAAKIGYRSTKVIAQSTAADAFRRHVERNLQTGRELGPDALPGWAWHHIDKIDNSFSAEMKSDLVVSGVIILQK
ncbi:class I SAM-dependent methyltransferase [Paraburkholderia sp. RL18-103-BIB-C]|uniref:class I SAM-dependent methyltransferase n=1 Tax=Paraburkholderia sp. RL18-103-BIB-C TaxID=3031637 RepID=UPI0038B6FBB2